MNTTINAAAPALNPATGAQAGSEQATTPVNLAPAAAAPSPFGSGEPAAAPLDLARTQAQRVFAKFGGARHLMRALERLAPEKHRDASSIYRWTHPRDKGGTDGVIPSAALADVCEAARIEGILLTADDLDPRRK